MKIYYDESPAGHGKTTRAIHKLITIPSKAIYCCERNETMDEIKALIHSIDPTIQVEIINSDNRQTNVKKRVEGLPQRFENLHHVIVLISHATMLATTFDHDFRDWQIVIDEVPSLLSIGHIQTKVSHSLLAKLYTLAPIGDGWSQVRLTPAGRSVSNADIANDGFAKPMRKFHQAVLRSEAGNGAMVARLADWNGASGNKKWFFANWFSFIDLAAFDRITLLGNQFLSSVAVKVVRHYDDLYAASQGIEIEWIPLPAVSSDHRPKPRKVNIQYFQISNASRYALSTETGKSNLEIISRHLAKELPENAIWSANNGDLDGDYQDDSDGCQSIADILSKVLTTGYIKPRQAGSNRYRHVDHAAFIFVANASNDTTAFLKLSGQDRDDWLESIEHEATLQFMARTSIRNAECDRPVFFYVLDTYDAQFIGEYFGQLGHDVVTEFVDLGLDTFVDGRFNNGRTKMNLTEDERIARRREQNKINQCKSRARAKASAKLAA